MKYFYQYSAGYCGTEAYGTMYADTIEEVYEAVEPEVRDHIEAYGCDEEQEDFEIELDIYVCEYKEEEHAGYF